MRLIFARQAVAVPARRKRDDRDQHSAIARGGIPGVVGPRRARSPTRRCAGRPEGLGGLRCQRSCGIPWERHDRALVTHVGKGANVTWASYGSSGSPFSYKVGTQYAAWSSGRSHGVTLGQRTSRRVGIRRLVAEVRVPVGSPVVRDTRLGHRCWRARTCISWRRPPVTGPAAAAGGIIMSRREVRTTGSRS